MKDLFFNLLNDEEGQGMVEYAIIIALISVVAIGIIKSIGGKVGTAYKEVDTKLDFAPAAGGN